MRDRVDADKRQGHRRCSAFAPALFEVDELGMSTEIGDGIVSPDAEALAPRAAANCLGARDRDRRGVVER